MSRGFSLLKFLWPLASSSTKEQDADVAYFDGMSAKHCAFPDTTAGLLQTPP